LAHLLDPADLRSIENLRLAPRKTFSGATHGERLTKKRGISIEFSDYRNYAEGDDLRHIDWNVLARLGVAVTKTYRDEEDLSVHLLLDASASMAFGEPSKFDCAVRLAWALGYIALCGGDTLHARVLGEAPLPSMRSRASVHRFSQWIGQVKPDQTVKLSDALTVFLRSNVRAGLVVLVSDGLDPGLPFALGALGARGHDLMFVQVLSDLELDPDLEGDLRLIDAESAKSVEVTANQFALAEYKRNLAAHSRAIEIAVQKAGGRHILVQNGQSFRDVFTDGLKRYGWVRR